MNFSLKGFLNSGNAVILMPFFFCLISHNVIRANVSPIMPDTAKTMHVDIRDIEVAGQKTGNSFQQSARIVTVIDREQIQKAPVQSLEDLLEFVSSIDIRQRGAEGVQADLTIRGSSSDQVLILLNGINISDPQTGHHNLNLPVDLSMIERIEILEGPAARVYAPNAFSGAVNIVTRELDPNSVNLNLEAGMHKLFATGVSGGIRTGEFNHTVALSRKSSDGYTKNTDFDFSNLFYNGFSTTVNGKIDLQAGFNDKGFGANSFYSPKFPEQYERTRVLFGSANYLSDSKFHWNPLVYWRRNQDEFMLFRNNPPSKNSPHNYHQTNVWGGGLSSWINTAWGKTTIGIHLRSEGIISNVLGKTMDKPRNVKGTDADYKRSADRLIFSAFAEHMVSLGGLSLSGAVMSYTSNLNGSEFITGFYPGLDVSYTFSDRFRWFLSMNESVRLPTFTELYYSDPTHHGNSGLKTETATSAETGLKMKGKFISGNLIYFYRNGKNLIDWVMQPGSEVWETMNYTQVKSRGIEMNLDIKPGELAGRKFFITLLKVGFLNNKMEKTETGLISHYLLDYLKYKVNFALQHNIADNLDAVWEIIYQDRNGTYTLYTETGFAGEVPYGSFWLANGKITYHRKLFNFFLSGSNLLNKTYFDYGNIRQPGFWLKAGFTVNLGFNPAG